MTFAFQKKEPLPDAIRRVASEQLRHALLETSRKKVPPKSIHNARKAIKRVRAVLQLLRCGCQPDAVKNEDRFLRDAGRLLGATRDVHVQWQAFQQLGICKTDGICRVLAD